MRLLVVEDEPDMNRLLSERMQMENFVVDSCFDGDIAYEYMKMIKYDAVILDVMIPGMDGFTLVKKIRLEQNQVPIIMLTAKADPADIVRGLDSGADDYLVKPFDFSVLLARLRAIMRKSTGNRENVLRCGTLEVYVAEQQVFREKRKIDLSAREFQILLFMVRNQNQVLSRDQIQSNVWKEDGGKASNVVDVYIWYLRKKIDEGYDYKMIQTVRGMGYRLACPEENKDR